MTRKRVWLSVLLVLALLCVSSAYAAGEQSGEWYFSDIQYEHAEYINGSWRCHINQGDEINLRINITFPETAPDGSDPVYGARLFDSTGNMMNISVMTVPLIGQQSQKPLGFIAYSNAPLEVGAYVLEASCAYAGISKTWDIAVLIETQTSGSCGDNLTWTLENGVLTISGTGAMADYENGWDAVKQENTCTTPWYDIKESIISVQIEDGVTSIGSSAFYDFVNLTSIDIPDSVTSIGACAFAGSSSLTSVTIPDGVTEINDLVFASCVQLSAINIPDGVTSIGAYAFNGSGLTSVTIPDGVTFIAEGAFSFCDGLTSITLPDSVTSLGEGAFMGCFSLASATIPDSVDCISRYAFFSCENLTSITIPVSVTGIGEGAFNECFSLTDVYFAGTAYEWAAITIAADNDPLRNAAVHYTIPTSGVCGDNLTWSIEDGVLTISGTGPMYDYGWTTNENGIRDLETPWIGNNGWSIVPINQIVLPEGLTTIGDNAFCFYGPSRPASLVIPSTVTKLGQNALLLSYYSYNEIHIPASLVEINCFIGANSITVDSANPAFSAVDGVLFSKDGTILYACSRNKEGSYTVPSTVTSIRMNAFYNCRALTSVTVPDNVSEIEAYAFSGCTQLTQAIIEGEITELLDGVFSGCSAMTRVSLPAGLTSITWGAFEGTGITNVYFGGTSAEWAAITIADGNEPLNNATIHYNATTSGICGDNLTWSYNDGVLTISGYGDMDDYGWVSDDGWQTFRLNTPWYGLDISEVNLPEGLTSIGDNAFFFLDSNSWLTSPLSIPSTVTRIGMNNLIFTFYDVFHISAALVEIDSTINASSITVDSANPAFTIMDEVLLSKDLSQLIACLRGKEGSYTVPSTVTTIRSNAFNGCNLLTSVTVPANVMEMGGYVFGNCTALTEVVIECDITVLPSGTFNNCGSLTQVSLPAGLTSIGNSAFDGTGITDVYFAGTAAEWAEIPIAEGNDPLDNATIHYSVAASGVCGANLTWSIEDGVLTISGTGAMEDYTWGSAPWYNSASSIQSILIGEGVTHIGDYAFCMCTSASSVLLPSTLTSIGDDAFFYCSSLTGISLPSGLESIGNGAFGVCMALSEITIPASVTTIEDDAFCYTTSMTAINVTPNNSNYKSVNGVLFSKDGTVLHAFPGGIAGSYTVLSSVTTIRPWAFCGNDKLTKVVIPANVTTMGNNLFEYCTGLSEAVIESSVSTLPDRTFVGCDKLTKVTLPAGLTAIGTGAFTPRNDYVTDYADLADVFFGGSPEEWAAIAIADNNGKLDNVQMHYSGTIAQYSSPLVLPASTKVIESQAFANLNGYFNVTVPADIQTIADDAFSNSHVLLLVTSGSEGEAFAIRNKIPYIVQ